MTDKNKTRGLRAKAGKTNPAAFNDGSEFSGSIVSALRDPARLCPMFAGPCLIENDSALMRTVGGEIEVSAPQELLKLAFRLCDGSRSLAQISEAMEHQKESDLPVAEFLEFLHFLLEEKLLIDASTGCANSNSFALQRSSFGMGALPAVTGTIAERFSRPSSKAPLVSGRKTYRVKTAPLRPFFEARESQYTFDAKPAAPRELMQLLWSVAGIVKNEHPRLHQRGIAHRTIASAGSMHLLEVYVALQQEVGDVAPGVYRVVYPEERALQLVPVSGMQGLLPRAFGKPWQLKYATGAIFIAAASHIGALRYRNRSVQYLFMEAGAALHNAGLTAPQLGLGFATLGSYYEDIVKQLCVLDQQLVLGSAIFGKAATETQRRLEKAAAQFDFAWVQGYSDHYTLPFYMGRAELKGEPIELAPTWGRGKDPWMAVLKAQAEAIERLGYHEPKHVSLGRMADIPGAICPQEMIRYHGTQYANPAFPYRHFDETAAYAWAKGIDLLSGTVVHVLADLVFTRTSLIEQFGPLPPAYAQMTSSGCAAGITVEDATYRALLELIERDAFVFHWLYQQPGSVVQKKTMPSAIQERVRALEAAGCMVSVQKLDSTLAHVSLVSAQHAAKNFTTMATAASNNFTEATLSALEELEGRVFSHFSEHIHTLENVEDVRTPDHHFELYRFKAHFQKADKILFPKLTSNTLKTWPKTQRAGNLPSLLKRFEKAGKHPVLIEITPKKSAIDQGRTHLKVVRALVPGLLPIYFGHQREPLGMVPRILSGSKFPHPFP